MEVVQKHSQRSMRSQSAKHGCRGLHHLETCVLSWHCTVVHHAPEQMRKRGPAVRSSPRCGTPARCKSTCERFDEWEEGQRAPMLIAASGKDQETALHGANHGFLRQSRLANTRLTSQEHKPALAACGRVQSSHRPPQLGIARDE